MTDAVQSGTIIIPKPDEDEVSDFERDPLASGGGQPQRIDDVRAETGTRNDDPQPQELNTAEDLTKDALED